MFDLYTIEEIIYIITWAILGSVLGYVGFTDEPKAPPSVRYKRCIYSTLMGIFLAFPIFTYLIEHTNFSTRLCILFSGLGALGIPDFLIKHYPRISNILFHKIVGKDDSRYRNDDN